MFKNIVVTGGTGTLGTALRALVAEYPGRQFTFIGSAECDLVNLPQTVQFVRNLRPDAILHFAAKSGGIAYSTQYPATLLRDNILMTFSVLEAARLNNVLKVVLTLSTGMYPTKAPIPLKEEYIHEGPPHDSNYSYAFAKRLMETAIRAYREEYHLKVIGLVPNGIIGENTNFDRESAVMPAALIRRFYEERENGSPIVVWGDGTPLREISYSQDIAKAFMWCLDHYDDPQILNIGTTEEVSVKDTAYLIAEMMGIEMKRIVFDATKPPGQLRKGTDNSRFLKLSNFQYTPYRKALEKTVRYFIEHYHNPQRIRL